MSKGRIEFPESFADALGRTCVLGDIDRANYRLELDRATGSIEATSTLRFTMPSRGHFVFDLVPKSVLATRIRPEGDLVIGVGTTEFGGDATNGLCRILETELDAGIHQIRFVHSLPMKSTGRIFATSMFDLAPRRFLEQYLPTGFEDDAYDATMEILVVDSGPDTVEIRSNGVERKIGPGHWEIVFPSQFNCSSFYVHANEVGELVSTTRTHGSLEIEFVSHHANHASLVSRIEPFVVSTLATLSSTFGRPPALNRLLLFCSDAGDGMEYAGAAEVIGHASHVFHELAHQYFGRYIRPASGRSGWFDEAVAEWIFWGRKPSIGRPRPHGRVLTGSPFMRETPESRYEDGMAVLAYLDHVFASLGGIVPILTSMLTPERIISNASILEAFREAASSSPDIADEFERTWIRFVDPDATSNKEKMVPTNTNPPRQPIATLIRDVINVATDPTAASPLELEFASNPESFLGKRGFDDDEMRVVMTLDADLIVAFARLEEELQPSEVPPLLAGLHARLDRTDSLVSPRAAWPFPHPSVKNCDPQVADVGSKIPTILLEGSGLMAGSIVRLTKVPTGPSDARIEKSFEATLVSTGTDYVDRVLRVNDADLAGLPSGEYMVSVVTAIGLPSIRWINVFTIRAHS